MTGLKINESSKICKNDSCQASNTHVITAYVRHTVIKRTIVFAFLIIIGITAVFAQDVIPLKLYRNSKLHDNFTNSTLSDEEEAKENGYYYIRLEGYVFSPEYGEKLDQKLVKPLNVYWSEAKNDFFTTTVTL